MRRVIHTGQALVDTVVEVPGLPPRGQNVMASSAVDYVGGSVNVLVAAARSGAPAVQAGVIGTGPRGDLIRTVLAAEGIDAPAAPVPDLDTGVCIVFVEPSAERTFVTTLGAERRLSVAALAASAPQPGDMVCLLGYSLLMSTTAEPLLEWLPTLSGVDVVLDPCAVFADLDEGVREQALSYATVWSSNAEEAAALLRVKGKPAEGSMGELAAAIAGLLPGRVVVVRDGARGCAVVVDGELTEVPGFPQTPVDTNGAGDCHTGVLLAEVVKGADWAEACRRANAAAAIKVTRKGPATAPTAVEVDAFLTHDDGVTVVPDAGPEAPPSSTPRVGLDDGDVYRYSLVERGGTARLAESHHRVSAGDGLLLAVHPRLARDDQGRPDRRSARVAADVVFDDGSRLSDASVRDQHGHDLHAPQPATDKVWRGQGCLVPDQWNLWRLDLSPATGKVATAVELVGLPGGSGDGWVQVLGPSAAPPEAEPVDLVRTTRGTHSRHAFSRGNTFPATCVPHGMNFLTPVTDARTRHWLYDWHGDPHPKLQALAVSHQPSPWIADRGAVQLMPFTGEPAVDPVERQLEFRHADELDRPYHYRVRLAGGIVAEMAPTSRAGVFGFDLPEVGGVTIDQPFAGSLTATLDEHGHAVFHGWAPGNDIRPSLPSDPRCYFAGRTRQPVTVAATERAQAVHLHAPAGRLEVVLATSFISVEQAWANLAQEVGDRTFDEVRDAARTSWQDLLGRLELDGATHDQQVAAYSNLYRLYAYPNAAHEHVMTAEGPAVMHAAVSEPLVRPHSDTESGCAIRPGRLYVNNGYWDTYRTCWPAYHLLTPDHAPRLLDGILALYRDGGWMGRWSAPGFVDCMVGTSSDVIYADAAEHGIAFDEVTAYESALRNAMTPSDSPVVGRKGIGRGRFVGYVDAETPEGMSWSLENNINDAGMARWSRRLAERETDPVRKAEYEANAHYLTNRALGWRLLFDEASGFIAGRFRDGTTTAAEGFDPRVWGGDYTETNAWGMAFTPVFDGVGLAEAYGGRDGLAAKLDAFFADPESAREEQKGTYGHVLHEMVEARAIGMGQLALSNQPAHHIPYLWLHTDQPHRASEVVRECLDRLFTGSEIGQGWPGDEDNGEMSAWWLFAALGLYPLDLASGQFVLTAPLLPRMSWRRTDDSVLEVRASGVEHPYVQSVRVNGQQWAVPYVDVATLHGDCLVEVELGPEPSEWGRGEYPASLAGEGVRWRPDLTTGRPVAGSIPASVIDDTGEHAVAATRGDHVEVTLEEASELAWYTVTGDGALGWAVDVRTDGRWHEVDRQDVVFRWQNETRAFLFPSATTAEGVRVTVTSPGVLRQVEVC